MTRTPIQSTTKYATTVNDLPEAWAFIMDRLDRVGPDPTIRIAPVWTISLDDEQPPRHFEVAVEGMVIGASPEETR